MFVFSRKCVICPYQSLTSQIVACDIILVALLNMGVYYILDPFPLAKGQVKFLIVSIDYFTKWIKFEPLAMITTQCDIHIEFVEFCHQ